MKKFLLILTTAVLSSSLAFAQLYKPKRIVEFGLNTNVSASQNMTGLTNLLVEDLVIDLTKIADGMGKDGFVLNTTGDVDVHFDVNIGKRWGGGVFSNVTGYLNTGISKGFWDLLAYGNTNEDGSVKDVDFDVFVNSEVFAEMGAKVKFGINRLGITIKPTYYTPVLYIPYSAVNMKFATGDGKTASFTGKANLDIYTANDISGAIDTTDGFSFDSSALSSSFNSDTISDMITKNGGFSIAVAADYPILGFLTVGAYADVPLAPGKLHYKTTATADVAVEVNGVLDSFSSSLGDSSGESGDTTPGDSSSTEDSSASEMYSYDMNYTMGETVAVDYDVRKPLRLGIEAACYPFGRWCTFRGMIGYAARNPFGEDWNWKNSMFMEYSAGVDLSLLYVFRFYAQTSYIDKVFAHQAGLGFNFRVMEITAKIASCGTDFDKSFALSGMKFNLGFAMGF